MPRRRTAAIAVGLTATLTVATACSSASAGRGDSHADTLRIVGPFEVHSLEPAASSGIFTRLQVAETLVGSDLEGELEPALAISWDSDPTQRRWTFELPGGATFHDGTPVTPETVAAALSTAAEDEASPLADVPLEEVAATTDGVELRLSRAYPTLPATLTHYSTAILAPASYDDGGRVTEVIGTGPYRIDSVELPASVTTVRFGGWRGAAPAVERVHFQSAGRAETRALMALSDQADVVFGLEPAGRDKVDAAAGVRMESTLQPRSLYLKANGEHPILGDVRVRRALSLGLDRESIAMAVLREQDLAATQLFPPSLPQWHDDDLEPLAHNPEAARALLAEAGWTPGPHGTLTKDGDPLRLTLTTYPDRPELPALATAIQAELGEIGVEVEVDVTNSSEIPARHADGSLELGLLARHLALVADPLVTVADTFAAGGSDWGVTSWSDPEVLAAIDALLAGTGGEAAAERHRATITERAQAELPVIPVAWYRMNAAVSDRVGGFVLDPLEHTWRITAVEWS